MVAIQTTPARMAIRPRVQRRPWVSVRNPPTMGPRYVEQELASARSIQKAFMRDKRERASATYPEQVLEKER